MTLSFREAALRSAEALGLDGSGIETSHAAGVHVFRLDETLPRQPFPYEPQIVLIAQGQKTGWLEGAAFAYGEDRLLIVGVPVPFECEAAATPRKPLVGLRVDIDEAQLRRVAARLAEHSSRAPDALTAGAVTCVTMTAALRDVARRIAQAAGDATEAAVLGPLAIEELYARLLLGPRGTALSALAFPSSTHARVARSVAAMRGDNQRRWDVKTLAQEVGMSRSSYHRAFRQITGLAPMAYLKQLRLHRARELLTHQAVSASEAAYAVGYNSASQFSREFKRYFGAPPSQAR